MELDGTMNTSISGHLTSFSNSLRSAMDYLTSPDNYTDPFYTTDLPDFTLDFNSTDSPIHSALNATSSADPEVKNVARTKVIMVVYAIGILGNMVAIVTLRIGEQRVRNRKHLLLLTSLALNDLLALMGMLCAMLVSDLMPGVKDTQIYCGARVLLRTFGIGSVCIAVTMALERYLALTRPFLYQKQVTYYMIRTALLVSWVMAAVLTCLPVAGIGLYYEYDTVEEKSKCRRYREASAPLDVGYAVVWVLFGTLLCIVLVYCNLAVIRALYAITAPRGAAPLVRRVSKTSCRQRQRTLAAGDGGGAAQGYHNAATAEEVAFSRLMAMLSVLFMICWLPQMVTSVLYLALGELHWKRLSWVANLSDVMMLLNYVLDPYLYVLMRRRRPLATLCHSIARCFKRGHKISNESISLKTSCCAPETVISDGTSASAETRPLRALAGGVPPSAVGLQVGLGSRKTQDHKL